MSHHFLAALVFEAAPVDTIISIWHLVRRYPLIKIAPSLCLNGCYLKICAKLNLNPLSAPFWSWWPWSTISKSLHYIRVFIEKTSCNVNMWGIAVWKPWLNLPSTRIFYSIQARSLWCMVVIKTGCRNVFVRNSKFHTRY